ncbi:MAG: hypothetical protein K2O11_04820 [Oscillospiraceae bacterium]|nr:hypothetical protein [Oscillospiraceae bacterium]
MNTKMIVLTVLMVICGIFLLGPMCLAMRMEAQERKKRGELPPGKALYDERQTIIRLRAGVHALFALGGYLVLWAALDLIGGQKGGWAWTGEVAPLVLGGVMLAALVWTVECTLRDAAVGWNQKNGVASAMYGTYASQLVFWGGKFLDSGDTVLGCVMFLSAAGLLAALVAELCAYRRQKKLLEQEGE